MNSFNTDLHRQLWQHGDRDSFPPAGHIEPVRFRTLSSADIFERGEHEIGIAHGDALYRLKITRQGKLILNK